MTCIDLARSLLVSALVVGWSSSAVAQDQPAETAAADRDEVEQEGLPLAPGRRVRASLSEGSWISLDVSPDGETIVFDLLGDLYSMPFSGGRAKNVLDDAKLRTFTPFEEIQVKALRRPKPGPGPSGWFHENQFTFSEISDFIDDVVEAGGQAGVGSHGQLQGLGYHWELWLVGSSSEMTNHEALTIATLVGARSLGLAGEVGSIEVGKLADLVVLDSNPLEDLRNSNTIDRVMKNGRMYDGDSLDEVWPRKRKAGPFYWQGDGWPATRAGIR